MSEVKEEVGEVKAPKIDMNEKLRENHAKTLAKLSILFANLSSDIRIADTYQDVKDAVLKTDEEMNSLSKEFDELEECLKP